MRLLRPVLLMYKHIIWDWNGTLLDDVNLSLKAINIVLARYGLPDLGRERYLKIFTFPVIEYYQKLGFDFNLTPFNIVGTEFIEEYTTRMFRVKLHRGAKEFMQFATEYGVSQSMLSAAKQQMLEQLTAHHGLEDYFIRIVGLDNHYAHSKLEAGKAWMKELPHPAKDIIYIGDTLHDVDVAHELGVDIVLLALGHTDTARLLTSGKLVVHNFSELKVWFLNQYNR